MILLYTRIVPNFYAHLWLNAVLLIFNIVILGVYNKY